MTQKSRGKDQKKYNKEFKYRRRSETEETQRKDDCSGLDMHFLWQRKGSLTDHGHEKIRKNKKRKTKN